MRGGITQVYTCEVYGFDKYVKAHVDNYGELLESVCLYVVNKGQIGGAINEPIIEETHIPRRIVDYILEVMEQNRFIRLTSVDSGRKLLVEISPKLRRALNS